VFHQQTFQGDVRFALVQAVYTDDGALALRRLLADRAQLVGVAVVEDGVQFHVDAVPVGHQLDVLLHFLRQFGVQRALLSSQIA